MQKQSTRIYIFKLLNDAISLSGHNQFKIIALGLEWRNDVQPASPCVRHARRSLFSFFFFLFLRHAPLSCSENNVLIWRRPGRGGFILSVPLNAAKISGHYAENMNVSLCLKVSESLRACTLKYKFTKCTACCWLSNNRVLFCWPRARRV